MVQCQRPHRHDDRRTFGAIDGGERLTTDHTVDGDALPARTEGRLKHTGRGVGAHPYNEVQHLRGDDRVLDLMQSEPKPVVDAVYLLGLPLAEMLEVDVGVLRP